MRVKKMFCFGMFLVEYPVLHLYDIVPAWNTPLNGEIVENISKKSFHCCLSELDGGWREFVVNRNVLATAWITLLTPEEADNLSAAQQGRLNVTRQPNHLLMKAWQRQSEPPHREQNPWQAELSFCWVFTRDYSFNASRRSRFVKTNKSEPSAGNPAFNLV